MAKSYSKVAAGTFVLNKHEPIHSWYSYLEGYSSCLIEDLIDRLVNERGIKSVYDPFCGTGTTSLVASSKGLDSYYSETNPFMRKVIEAKINSVRSLIENDILAKGLLDFRQKVVKTDLDTFPEIEEWGGFEKFFLSDNLAKLLYLKDLIDEFDTDSDTKEILQIALASIVVRSSRMKRQGDLRFAKDGEKKDEDNNVIDNFIKKLEAMIKDISSSKNIPKKNTVCLADDCRFIESENCFDCAITSPPYLNGTNYIRNTKLELKLCDFIHTEKDMPKFHSKGIIAGINNVSKRSAISSIPAHAIDYVEKLIPVAYDRRIPEMVAGYFSDMNAFISKLSGGLKDGGVFIMDIGDSQFAGVHIPTHEILSNICKDHGLTLVGEEILRERRSKNGMVLSQRLLTFELDKAAKK